MVVAVVVVLESLVKAAKLMFPAVESEVELSTVDSNVGTVSEMAAAILVGRP